MMKIQNTHVDWRYRWIRILKENSKTEVARVIPFEASSRLEKLVFSPWTMPANPHGWRAAWHVSIKAVAHALLLEQLTAFGTAWGSAHKEWGRSFDYQDEFRKVLQEPPAVSFEAAVIRVLGQQAHPLDGGTGGFNIFDLEGEWLTYLRSNSAGQFNEFDTEGEWLGFTTSCRL